MRSAIFAAVALASAVAVKATSIPGLPPCTSNCIDNTYGGCGSLNVKCICESSSWIAGLACCISVACDAADQNKTINFADSLCQGYGVTNLPTAATCAAGETPSFVSGATISYTASSSATGSPTDSGSATLTSAPGSVSHASSAAAETTGSSGTTPSATGAGATPSKTGAANRIEVAALGMGAVVFGALAAL